MNNEKRILELAKNNNGCITTEIVEKEGIKRQFLGYLVKKGKLEKIEHGIYILPTELEDIYYILQNKSKKLVFSHTTALFFHNLSDRMPHIIDLTVTDTYRGSLQKRKDINLFRVKEQYIELGLTFTYSLFGNKIKIYDIERCICDIIRNKKEIELELFNKAIRGYFYSKTKDTNKLYDYAKRLNVYEEVRKTFEVLTWLLILIA